VNTDRLGNYSGELLQGVAALPAPRNKLAESSNFVAPAIVSHLRLTTPRRYRKCGMTAWTNSVIDCFTSAGSISPPWLKSQMNSSILSMQLPNPDAIFQVAEHPHLAVHISIGEALHVALTVYVPTQVGEIAISAGRVRWAPTDLLEAVSQLALEQHPTPY
jgi:hypothetical protein